MISKLPSFIYKNNRNLLHISREYEGTPFTINVDPIIYRDFYSNNLDSISTRENTFSYTHGIQIWGKLGNNFGFFVDGRDSREWGDKSYFTGAMSTMPGLGHVAGKGDYIDHDEFESYFAYNYKFINIEYGKGENKWGPGFRGQLMLSDYSTSYDQIKAVFAFWKIRLTSFTGFLEAFPRIVEREYIP